jgi:anti-anti-sigma factor
MSLIRVSHAQGQVPVTVFHLQDRVNLGNTKELERAAQEAYEDGMRNLVIDLSEAPSLTSAGIRAIVSLHKMLMKDEGNPSAKHLKLVSPTSYVREVLDIAGLSDYLEIYDDLDGAVASF